MTAGIAATQNRNPATVSSNLPSNGRREIELSQAPDWCRNLDTEALERDAKDWLMIGMSQWELHPHERREARDLVAQCLAGLTSKPSPDVVRDWLILLGTLCAGRMDRTEAEVRCAAYAEHLDRPIGCYSKAARIRAAANDWFPSFAEVDRVLAAEEWFIRRRLARLNAMLNAKAPVPEPVETQEQRDRVAGMMRQAARNLDAKRPATINRIQRPPGAPLPSDDPSPRPEAPTPSGGQISGGNPHSNGEAHGHAGTEAD